MPFQQRLNPCYRNFLDITFNTIDALTGWNIAKIIFKIAENHCKTFARR